MDFIQEILNEFNLSAISTIIILLISLIVTIRSN